MLLAVAYGLRQNSHTAAYRTRVHGRLHYQISLYYAQLKIIICQVGHLILVKVFLDSKILNAVF